MKEYAFKGKDGLEVVSLNKLTTHSIDAVAELHRVNFYQIYCFRQNTKGVLEINFERITIKPNSLLFVPANVVCSFAKTAVYDGSVIIFTDFFVNNHTTSTNNILFSKLFRRFRPPLLLDDVNPTPIRALIRLMQLELNTPQGHNHQNILLNYLENIVLYAERSSPEAAPPLPEHHLPEQLIARFYDLINGHYQDQHSLKYYCEALGVTYAELSKTVNDVVGINPKTLLHQKIILEAKSLLAYTDQSIKQICYKVGFNEPSYFSIFFKKYQGCTPKEFQKKYKESEKNHNSQQ